MASRIRAGSDINARILSPVFAPLVVFFLWMFEYVRSRAQQRMGGAVKAIAVLGLVGLAAFGVWSVALAWSHGREGRGFASARGANSELVAAAGRLSPKAHLYSDNPLSIAYVTERQPVDLLLAPGQQNVIGRAHPSAEELERAACSRAIWVAWFGNEDALPVTLSDVQQFDDGVLGKVEPSCR